MKQLLLLRHAKAVTDRTGGDHGRALAPRGRRAAPLMGRAMRTRGLVPGRVLCSAATRTKETWQLAEPELKAKPQVEFTEAIYLAPWAMIVKTVRETPDDVQTLLVIGHNPGIEDCAAALLNASAGGAELTRREAMAEKFPTGALAVLDCDIARWKDMAPGTAALADFLRPRDLED
jgi:phosphohistidine phosphatase